MCLDDMQQILSLRLVRLLSELLNFIKQTVHQCHMNVWNCCPSAWPVTQLCSSDFPALNWPLGAVTLWTDRTGWCRHTGRLSIKRLNFLLFWQRRDQFLLNKFGEDYQLSVLSAGFMMEMASWDGGISRTVQFLVPKVRTKCFTHIFWFAF